MPPPGPPAERAARLNAHRRLGVGLAIFAALLVVLPSSMPMSLRLALAWDCGVVAFLAITGWVVRRSEREDMRATVLAHDQGRATVLALVLVAIASSMAAIFFLLEKPRAHGDAPALQVLAAVATIVCSWLLTHVMYALHYAHRYYRDNPRTPADDATGGLAFPGTDAPHYWDFLYFSFVIGMTCQVSDVQVTSHPMRRLVLWHGALSFAFNTVVLALSINIVAGLI